MKKLNGQQASLVFMTLIIFVNPLSNLVAKKYFSAYSDSVLRNVFLPFLVFFVVVGLGSFIMHRFFMEKPEDRQQTFQPFGWKSALYLYALSLLYFYFNHYKPGGGLGRMLALSLIFPALCVLLSRLIYRAQTSDSKTIQS